MSKEVKKETAEKTSKTAKELQQEVRDDVDGRRQNTEKSVCLFRNPCHIPAKQKQLDKQTSARHNNIWRQYCCESKSDGNKTV